MVTDAGVVRSGTNLATLQHWIASKRRDVSFPQSEAELESANLFLLAAVLAEAAQAREESRGAHFRSDFPDTDERWRVRQCLSRSENGTLQRSLSEVTAAEANAVAL